MRLQDLILLVLAAFGTAVCIAFAFEDFWHGHSVDGMKGAAFSFLLGVMLWIVWRDSVSARLVEKRQALLRCLHCGYDLTANESGRCPECGRARRNMPKPKTVEIPSEIP